MKLKQKKKIINTSNLKNKTGFIFIANDLNSNSKKQLLLNKTKIYKKGDYHFDLYDNKIISKNFITENFNISNKDIIEIIDINNKNFKLKIVLIKYNTNLEGFETKIYLDLLKNNSNISGKIYNFIYFYNFNHDNYLSSKIHSKDSNIYIKLIDLYYFLIGYI